MTHHALFAVAVVMSHLEACQNRVLISAMDGPRPYRGFDRRTNPRQCGLCGGPMQKDFRGARDVRGLDGKVRRAAQDTLKWFRCGRCHRSQLGVREA